MEEVMKFMAEKLNEALALFKNAGAEMALTWFDGVFPPEARAKKIIICQVALRNSGEAALAWFNRVCPPETRARLPKARLFIAGAAAIVAFLFFCGGGGGGGPKMMKAPGRGHWIPRSGFEENPRGYFRELRGRE